MPANLPPQYVKAEEEMRRATAPAERLELLRELFRLLPKHKGTEKLQSDLKTRISRARDDLDAGKWAGGGRKGGVSHRVPRDGAGQVVLVGGPNAGKSALLAALTNARPEVAAYPFTTRAEGPGMMDWLDVRVQLVDLPPISEDFFEPWVPALIRSADAALLVVDLGSDDAIDAAEVALARLVEARVELVGDLPFDSEDESTRHVRTAIVANKVDAEGAADRLAILDEWAAGRFPIVEASAAGGGPLDAVRSTAYDLLGVIRVYTKVPGRPIDRSHPFTIPSGGSALELAREVHRDLEQSLKFAKVWPSGGGDARTIKRDGELQDGDAVELHA